LYAQHGCPCEEHDVALTKHNKNSACYLVPKYKKRNEKSAFKETLFKTTISRKPENVQKLTLLIFKCNIY